MNKIYLIFILFCFFASKTISQTFGNEWIDYSRQYFSFPVTKSGIFRIDYSVLETAGIPLSTIQSENLQVFGRDKEIPIYIEDGNDSSLDSGDYILFYADKNDGWLDSTLYEDSTWIGNPAYSLFSDTIHYFVSWNNSVSNLRYNATFDSDFSSYTPLDYILQKVNSTYASFYNQGADRTSLASSSLYKGGEGYGLEQVNGVNGYTLSINVLTRSPYLGNEAPSPIFNAISTTNSNSNYTGIGNHHTRWTVGSNNTVLHDEITLGYKLIKVNSTVSILDLINGNSPFKWSIVNDQGAASDFQSLNYWSLIYPRIPNLSNATNADFYVQNKINQGKIRLDLASANFTNPVMFVIGDQPTKPVLIKTGAIFSALIPNSLTSSDQRVIIQNLSSATVVNLLKPVTSTGYFSDFTSVNLEDALLMVFHDSLENTVQDYKTYRESLTGGGNNVIAANINELYFQFGGGVKKHINAIRRFNFYVYSSATVKPKACFLMGKAITSSSARTNVSNYFNNFIPTFGFPASDVSITSDFKNGNRAPLVPVGRIAVDNTVDLQNYLDKVVQYEMQQDPNSVYDSNSKLWQKKVIHFGGGDQAADQNVFQGFLNNMESSIEDSLFGGDVYRIYKKVSTPFDPTHLSTISNLIREGVSIMTFFGHGYLGGFDINIDEPSEWGNTGKYPLVIANSCHNGNMFINNKSVAIIKYVNVPNGGAIAYIGSTEQGLDIALGQYTNKLYEQIANKSYGESISTQIKNTIEDILATGNSNVTYETALLQMNLNGDPLIKVNAHEKPEIEISADKIWFTPQDFDLTVDSIQVNVELTNLGKAITDTFKLEIRRNFPLSVLDSIYVLSIPKLYFKDTIRFKIPMQANIGIGINNISVKVDLPSNIDEQYDEFNNNQVDKTLFININGILPVLPSDFAVVPLDTVVVKASTINPIADFNSYRFELDTTDSFNSPMHRYAIVSGLGGVKEVNWDEWKSVSTNASASLVMADSSVYFWRVAIDSSVLNWRQRSFQYIKNKEGWGQDHFSQFKKNGVNQIELDTVNSLRVFQEVIADTLSVNVLPWTGAAHAFFINGQQKDYGMCGFPNPTFNVVVVDAFSHVNWQTRYVPSGSNLGNNFGNHNDNGKCRSRSEGYFSFLQNSTASLQAMENMLLNSVPDSSYVLIYSSLGTDFNAVNTTYPNLFNTFSAAGSDSINSTRTYSSFAFMYKKGDPNSAIEKFGSNVKLKMALKKTEYIATEETPLIGPSSSWESMFWKQSPMELNSPDSTVLKIHLYNEYKSLQAIIDTSFTQNDSIINLQNLIDASLYPYIKLSASYYDSLAYTPAQIGYWHVLFHPLPEAAIDGTFPYTWTPSKDTLDEGEEVSFAVDVKNIYKYPMDSILVKYWVEDNERVKHFLPYNRLDSLRVGETIRDTVSFSTIGFSGINSFWMEVNPYVNGNLFVTDQPEQEHFNNLLQIPFFVRSDKKNPLLDVTFDGVHILNNDIISPSSEIVITLKDENPLLLMNSDADTTLFGIYIIDPDGGQKRIPFVNSKGETVMQWIPADASTNKFKIIYPSNFEKNGIYTLLVQGADRSGNLSGDLEYKITFEIIRESSITNLMNYPNPFSTKTKFVFTLTGTEIPDNMIIQILTVSGKVVREITQAELGVIRIGRNITEYAWDGKDEFGDPLANGVYLYRVKTQLNYEEMNHRDSGADQYFKKGFGKMYLMR